MSPERRERRRRQATPGGGLRHAVRIPDATAGEDSAAAGLADRDPRTSAVVPAAPPATSAPSDAGADDIDRYIIPPPSLRFEGETGRRSWGVALTADQAARAGPLAVTHNSSIYVAPEDSRPCASASTIRLVLDEAAFRPREADGRVTVPIPAGTLRAGINVVTFEVVAAPSDRLHGRSRPTSCGPTSRVREPADLRRRGAARTSPASTTCAAVGIRRRRNDDLRVVLPAASRCWPTADILRLVQAIVLRGNFRQPRVEIDVAAARQRARRAPCRSPSARRVTLAAIAGTARQRQRCADGRLRRARPARRRCWSSRVPTRGGHSGNRPDRRGVERPRDVAPTVDQHDAMAPAAGSDPDRRQRTLQFRRTGDTHRGILRTPLPRRFHIALPGDFYAEAYGKATHLSRCRLHRRGQAGKPHRRLCQRLHRRQHAADIALRRHLPASADQRRPDPFPARREPGHDRGRPRYRGRRGLRARVPPPAARPVRDLRHQRIPDAGFRPDRSLAESCRPGRHRHAL